MQSLGAGWERLTRVSEASNTTTNVQYPEDVTLHNGVYARLNGVPKTLRDEFPPARQHST